MMSDGRSEWPVCQGGRRGPRYLLIERLAMGARDALMVSGFDILGQNRTLQVHWTKRIVAFALDCVVVLAPVWTVLFLLGERRIAADGGLSRGGFLGRMTLGKAAVRNVPKLLWFLFTLLDTIAGLVVEGDPRQRFSDRILGTTVAQSSLIHVRVHRLQAPE